MEEGPATRRVPPRPLSTSYARKAGARVPSQRSTHHHPRRWRPTSAPAPPPRTSPIEADRRQRRRPHPTPQTRSHRPNPSIQMWITPPPPPEPTPKSTSSTTRRIDAAAGPKPVTMTTTSERQTGSHRFGRWRGPVCSRIRAMFSAILAVLVVSAAAFGGIGVQDGRRARSRLFALVNASRH